MGGRASPWATGPEQDKSFFADLGDLCPQCMQLLKGLCMRAQRVGAGGGQGGAERGGEGECMAARGIRLSGFVWCQAASLGHACSPVQARLWGCLGRASVPADTTEAHPARESVRA